MNFQGTGIYIQSTDTSQNLVYAYSLTNSIKLIDIHTLKHYTISPRIFELGGYDLYLPAEDRSLDQMLLDHPELLL